MQDCSPAQACASTDGGRAALQGKGIVAVAAAKRHTVVLTAEGDVLTWGHRIVTPRRVHLAGGACDLAL